MRRTRVAGVALFTALLTPGGPAAAAADENARAAAAPDDPGDWQRPVRFTAGALAGTGYGWADATGDVNADTPFSGGSRAGLGHVIPEAGLLFPRARLFVLVSARYQVVTGTTDIYGSSFIAHTRSSAFALFQKVGWFPRAAGARLQPYLAFVTGRGTIAHMARFPSLRNCGPAQNQVCVDTVSLGPWFVGAGTGFRLRLTDHLDALLAVDGQVGYEFPFNQRGYNIDANVGIAAVF